MDKLSLNHYQFRKKVLKLFGGEYSVMDADGNLLFYSKLKAFKLKEDIRIYHDKEMTQEVLQIQQRQLMDAWATFDIIDSASGQKVGALRRKGLKSILKDEWLILDALDQEIGKLFEPSLMMALLARFLPLVPQKYVLTHGETEIAHFKNNVNPLVHKISCDIVSPDAARLMVIACGIMIMSVEGKQ